MAELFPLNRSTEWLQAGASTVQSEDRGVNRSMDLIYRAAAAAAAIFLLFSVL